MNLASFLEFAKMLAMSTRGVGFIARNTKTYYYILQMRKAQRVCVVWCGEADFVFSQFRRTMRGFTYMYGARACKASLNCARLYEYVVYRNEISNFNDLAFMCWYRYIDIVASTRINASFRANEYILLSVAPHPND